MPRLSAIGTASAAAYGFTTLSGIFTVTYAVIGGGGGGGVGAGAGGGAGGVLQGSAFLNIANTYSIVVGAAGNSSTFNGLTALGGGTGGSNNNNGANGSSGGGGGAGGSYPSNTNSTGGTGSQGGNGGTGYNYAVASYDAAGGGGGASGAAGGNGIDGVSYAQGGAGGAGVSSTVNGVTAAWGGGGGGSADYGPNLLNSFGGAGGYGGGGSGGYYISPNGQNATAYGGGGGGADFTGSGGTGYQGAVYVSYYGSQKWTGGTVSSVGGYTVHQFATIGSAALAPGYPVNYLVVGGTGASNNYNGGGAGQVQIVSGLLNLQTNYTVVVGSTASFNGTTALVGGDASGGNGGASYNGNGGGGFLGTTYDPIPSAPWTAGGYAGGGGGGGGAGGGGQGGDTALPSSYNTWGGFGGVGVLWSVNGQYYGVGQSGGSYSYSNTDGPEPPASNPGTPPSGYSGSIVIVSYTSATQLYTGGTVTSIGVGASTVWFHTFTTIGTSTLTHL